jgi:hypothetical protein
VFIDYSSPVQKADNEVESRCTTESSLVGFGVLDDNPIKGLTSVLSVEQVLYVKLMWFNTSEQV